MSILLPLRDGDPDPDSTLRSALAQSEASLEVVVALPGPVGAAPFPDAHADPRVRLVSASTDGLDDLVDAALDAATGEYVLVLLPGDLLDPVALQVLLDRADRGAFDVVQGGFTSVRPDGTAERVRLDAVMGGYEGTVDPAADPWFLTLRAATWAALYRRRFALENGLRLGASPDADLAALPWQSLAFALTRDAYFVDFPVCRHRESAAPPSTGGGSLLGLLEALRDEAARRGAPPAVMARLLVQAFVAVGLRPDVLPGRRDAGMRFARVLLGEVGRLVDATGALTGDPAFDDWVAVRTRVAVRRIAHRGIRGFWRMPARRAAKVTARRVASAAARRLGGERARRLVGPVVRAGLRGASERSGTARLPAIPQPRGFTGRNALVVVPWSDDNGSTRVIDALDDALHELGYRLHVVVYNAAGINPPRPGWDYAYDLADAPTFGRLHREDGAVVLDGHRIDEWVGDDLLQFVASAHRAWAFDLVVCHYVFLSRVLDVVGPGVPKILVTHDGFAGRNSRFAELGMTESYFFSTSEEQEAIGLRRADHVIALQSAEAGSFAERIGAGPTRVHTLPLLDEPRFLAQPPVTGVLRVGFLGSSYVNNRTALVGFFRSIRGRDLSALEFVIAGQVSSTLRRDDLPSQAKVLGAIPDVADFYGAVDVVFNPDFLESGRKVKVFEALSYGVPVVTTRASTAGFDDLPDDMRLSSSEQILERLLELAASPTELASARDRARTTYTGLAERYRTVPILRRMLGAGPDPEASAPA